MNRPPPGTPGRQAPIGVFDSGIGGLTVVRELRAALPYEGIVYFGDTARVPYGSKSPEVVREYALQIGRFMVGQSVKAIVVACNTVSSVALPLLRSHSECPVVGVIEPGARAAAAATRSGVIGVVGTIGTIESEAYERALHAIDRDLRVVQVACPLFVPLVEEGWEDRPEARSIAQIYLSPLLERGIDTLILGCTHYPVLRPTLQSVMGETVTLIDSAIATAAEVRELLEEKRLLTDGAGQSQPRFFVSDLPFRFKDISERFLGAPLASVERVHLDDLEGDFATSEG